MSNNVGLNLVPRSRAAKAAWKAACGNMAEDSTAVPLGLGDNIIGRAYFPGSDYLWLGIPSCAKVRFIFVSRCIETLSHRVISKKAPQQGIRLNDEIRRFPQNTRNYSGTFTCTVPRTVTRRGCSSFPLLKYTPCLLS